MMIKINYTNSDKKKAGVVKPVAGYVEFLCENTTMDKKAHFIRKKIILNIKHPNL